MIPQHLIDKAAMAAYDDHYWRDELYLLWGELGDRIQDEYRALARAALEAVAADIWDEGHEARQDEEASARVEYGATFTDIIPNPYRASETA